MFEDSDSVMLTHYKQEITDILIIIGGQDFFRTLWSKLSAHLLNRAMFGH
jgi:hypothetical protein